MSRSRYDIKPAWQGRLYMPKMPDIFRKGECQQKTDMLIFPRLCKGLKDNSFLTGETVSAQKITVGQIMAVITILMSPETAEKPL